MAGRFEVLAALLHTTVNQQEANAYDGEDGHTHEQQIDSSRVGGCNLGIASLVKSDHSQSEADKRQQESAHEPRLHGVDFANVRPSGRNAQPY